MSFEQLLSVHWVNTKATLSQIAEGSISDSLYLKSTFSLTSMKALPD